MQQILAYSVATGTNDSQVDMAAIGDPNFSRRGGSSGFGHWIFTEAYDLVAAFAIDPFATRRTWNVPSWNAIAQSEVQPVNRSTNMPGNPQVRDYRNYPPAIPQDEEIACLESGNNVGPAGEAFHIFWISPSGSQRSVTRGLQRVIMQFTATIAQSSQNWSVDAGITLSQTLKGGNYAVNGAYLQAANGLAFRLNFVRAPTYNGRKLLPGGLCWQAIGDVPQKEGIDWLGEWGRFNNFELPQVAVLSNTVASPGNVTATGYLDLAYLGMGG